MALRWDLSGIANKDEVCWLESPEDLPMQGVKKGEMVMNPVTNALIWSTIAVDLPGPTVENAGEFFARLRVHEMLNGPFLIRAEREDGTRPEGEDAFITMDEVIAHIGLSCNVSPVSRAKWLKRVGSWMDYEASRVERKQDELDFVEA
jgi:hypothetical protein